MHQTFNNIKIKIRVTQNVGRVWSCRKNKPSGPIWGNFRRTFMGWKNKLKSMDFAQMFVGSPIGCHFPGWGAAAIIRFAIELQVKALPLQTRKTGSGKPNT